MSFAPLAYLAIPIGGRPSAYPLAGGGFSPPPALTALHDLLSPVVPKHGLYVFSHAAFGGILGLPPIAGVQFNSGPLKPLTENQRMGEVARQAVRRVNDYRLRFAR